MEGRLSKEVVSKATLLAGDGRDLHRQQKHINPILTNRVMMMKNPATALSTMTMKVLVGNPTVKKYSERILSHKFEKSISDSRQNCTAPPTTTTTHYQQHVPMAAMCCNDLEVQATTSLKLFTQDEIRV